MIYKIIFLWKGIPEDTIIQDIKSGADTVEKVKEATGATTGYCHGSRCKGKIEELIAKYK